MVKRITLTLDDDLFEEWKARKGSKTWVEFVKDLIERVDECQRGREVSLCDDVRKLCKTLSEISKPCSRENVLLKICSGEEDTKDLVRLFVIVTNAIEERLEGRSRWLATLAKVLILDLVQGDVEDAYRVLKEICSISSPSL